MASELVESQTSIAWYPKKMVARLDLVLSDMRSMAEFESLKNFYFTPLDPQRDD